MAAKVSVSMMARLRLLIPLDRRWMKIFKTPSSMRRSSFYTVLALLSFTLEQTIAQRPEESIGRLPVCAVSQSA